MNKHITIFLYMCASMYGFHLSHGNNLLLCMEHPRSPRVIFSEGQNSPTGHSRSPRHISAETQTPLQRGHLLIAALTEAGNSSASFDNVRQALARAETLLTQAPSTIDVNVQGAHRRTPLHLTILAYKFLLKKQILDIIAALQRHRANLTLRDITEKTAAQYIIDLYNKPSLSPLTKQGLVEIARALGCADQLLEVTDVEDVVDEEDAPAAQQRRAPTPHSTAQPPQYGRHAHKADDLRVSDLSVAGHEDDAEGT